MESIRITVVLITAVPHPTPLPPQIRCGDAGGCVRRMNCASPPQEGTDDVAEGGELKGLGMCLVIFPSWWTPLWWVPDLTLLIKLLLFMDHIQYVHICLSFFSLCFDSAPFRLRSNITKQVQIWNLSGCFLQCVHTSFLITNKQSCSEMVIMKPICTHVS